MATTTETVSGIESESASETETEIESASDAT
jgi:hypothetical protein